ncbi:cytochrome c oxidase subunit 6b-2-like [Aphis craccivora]|uniref:Cytochrome c oxidase subunit 6b-2-like n=1 Tax=Aphis craccivora TaxID=307492 RepID=A0A6G0YNE0_APHCR|nr:cytochrome c oxidase subunit 6b-2-like [Aphis craccivora]
MSVSTEIGDLPNISCPMDPRFQNTNVSRYCFIHYVDYHRCLHLLGKDNATCEIFKDIYQRMCPNNWINTWDLRREKGNFARDCKTELD